MTIDIRYVNAVKNDQINAYVSEKLMHLFHKYESITRAIVFFKDEHHHKGNDYKCEIKLSLPGPQIFAAHIDSNFVKAVNRVIKDLDVQLTKRKGKQLKKQSTEVIY